MVWPYLALSLVTKASGLGVFWRDQWEFNALLRSLACKEYYT